MEHTRLEVDLRIRVLAQRWPIVRRVRLRTEQDNRLQTETALAEKAGLALAQMFYKHEITESATRR